LQAHRTFSKLTITQIMRNLSREHDLQTFLGFFARPLEKGE